MHSRSAQCFELEIFARRRGANEIVILILQRQQEYPTAASDVVSMNRLAWACCWSLNNAPLPAWMRSKSKGPRISDSDDQRYESGHLTGDVKRRTQYSIAQVGEFVVVSVFASREFNVETQSVVGQFDTFWQ